MTAPRAGRTLLLVARIPQPGVAAFQQYEATVLPLLADHGGTLERRLRNADGTFEAHVVHFSSEAALDRYRADPRRAAAHPLLLDSAATLEVTVVDDVD